MYELASIYLHGNDIMFPVQSEYVSIYWLVNDLTWIE